ncbi:hypothetical protein AVEN_28578-1 [Araneus ventricosus]|uniref:Uncharacterized protein n=1 Tax=Araneus ventricosus TaxID=182803 RepID=A0A4Y2RLQ4_ARAVE|nr:hypothetical protein AVEN_28578-1 [Araneus ventricosus]
MSLPGVKRDVRNDRGTRIRPFLSAERKPLTFRGRKEKRSQPNRGDELHCVGSKDRFILQQAEISSQYILVATASGVAPHRSMLPANAKQSKQDDRLKATLIPGIRYVIA